MIEPLRGHCFSALSSLRQSTTRPLGLSRNNATVIVDDLLARAPNAMAFPQSFTPPFGINWRACAPRSDFTSVYNERWSLSASSSCAITAGGTTATLAPMRSTATEPTCSACALESRCSPVAAACSST